MKSDAEKLTHIQPTGNCARLLFAGRGKIPAIPPLGKRFAEQTRVHGLHARYEVCYLVLGQPLSQVKPHALGHLP
jgi:hypothetical protein